MLQATPVTIPAAPPMVQPQTANQTQIGAGSLSDFIWQPPTAEELGRLNYGIKPRNALITYESQMRFNNSIARGTDGIGINYVGKFDPRNLKSITLNSTTIGSIRDKVDDVLKHGGILSIHGHHNDGAGPKFDQIIKDFKAQGRVLFLKDLIGYGKPY